MYIFAVSPYWSV